MYCWFKIDLGDAMLADEALAGVGDRLRGVWAAEGRAENMLAVTRHESQGLHCHLMVYLTAAFQRAAVLEGAVGCGAPPRSGSALLVGGPRVTG